MFLALRKKCPYSELFWLVFPAFGDTNISPYSVRMRENTDQNKSEYGHFLRSVWVYSTAWKVSKYGDISGPYLNPFHIV